MRHELKIWPQYFDLVRRGRKPFEVRRNDRGFKEWDTLILEEFDPNAKVYTGSTLTCIVTCVVSGDDFGIASGFVVMGIHVTGSCIASAKEAAR